jgi:hypothetical protein
MGLRAGSVVLEKRKIKYFSTNDIPFPGAPFCSVVTLLADEIIEKWCV